MPSERTTTTRSKPVPGSTLRHVLLMAAFAWTGCHRASGPDSIAAISGNAGPAPTHDAGQVSAGAHSGGHSGGAAGAIAAGSGGTAAGVSTASDAGNSDNDAGPTNAGEAVPSLETAMQRYPDWTKRTAEPLAISNEIFALCRAPSAAEQAFGESEHGQGLYLLDWLNEGALRGFANQAAPFPVGAAIVKQKLRNSSDGKLALAALGIMVKHAPGFDSAHGDWQFGYWEPTAGLIATPDEAAHCGGCHAGSSTDFVFLDQTWRTGR